EMVVAALGDIAKADDTQPARAEDFKYAGRFQHRLRIVRERKTVADEPPEPLQSQHLYRHPDLESPKPPREGHAVIGVIDFSLVRCHVLEVIRPASERRRQETAVAGEEAADVKRLSKPLVWIERHRVCVTDSSEFAAAFVGQSRGPAVGGIDVEPEAFLS